MFKDLKEGQTHSIEDLWDWICVQVGFDKDGKELQKAIRLLLTEEFKRGYNKALKDFKIPNEFGQHSL